MQGGAAGAAIRAPYAARIAASVKAYEPSDREPLKAFQREHFGVGSRQCDERYFEWLYERNPHRRDGAPMLWICMRDGMVVGQQGRLPVVLHARGTELHASWGIDLMVHPDWRLKGVGPALFAEFERSSDILLGLGVSDAAHRTCVRSGWTDLGMLPIYARPLDLDACAAALGGRGRLARLMPGAIVAGSARARAAIGRFRGYSIEPIAAFDRRADDLWIRAAPDNRVLAKRDFVSLRWRFDQIPDRGRYERYYVLRRGEVVGYAVMRPDLWRGCGVTRVVDYLCEERSTDALLALVIDAARRQTAAAVFLEQFGLAHPRNLVALGCFPAGAATRFMVRPHRMHVHARLLTEPSSWLISRSDSDSDLASAAPS